MIAENITWNGINILDKDLYIMGGAKLTLAENTTVKVNDNLKLVIMDGGELESLGTENNPVQIISSSGTPSNDDWEGIEIKGKDAIITGRLTISNAYTAVDFPYFMNFTLNKITFIDNYKTIFFNDNFFSNKTLQFKNCKFINSPITGYPVSIDTYVNIENSFFDNSTIFSNASLFTIKNNTFVNQSTCDADIEAKNNIFYNCGFALDPASGIIENNCFYPYQTSYNNFTGTGNFSTDPKFVDANNGDYHLLENSPCIDAGDIASDYSLEPGNNGSRKNLGMYGNTEEATQTNPENPPTWSNEIVFLGNFTGTGKIVAEQGLTAKTTDGKSIKIKGEFDAIGSQESEITFTANNSQWKGLFFDEGSIASLDFCVVNNSEKEYIINSLNPQL